jgi:hypothetical protein
VQPTVNKDVGYMFIMVDKEQYSPGQTVFGSVFFELFRIGYQTNLILRVEGQEILPQRLQALFAEEPTEPIKETENSPLKLRTVKDNKGAKEEEGTTFRAKFPDKRKELEEVMKLFRLEQRLFTFRSKHVAAGQYEFPFSFRLPHKLPSSFHFINP